jgi:hypothetical protein
LCSLLLLLLSALVCISCLCSLLSSHCSLLSGLGFLLCARCSLLPAPVSTILTLGSASTCTKMTD